MEGRKMIGDGNLENDVLNFRWHNQTLDISFLRWLLQTDFPQGIPQGATWLNTNIFVGVKVIQIQLASMG